jgi:hypothetical protein
MKMEELMKFANLVWAMREKGLPNYRVAQGVGMTETAFSKALTGRSAFSPDQRYAIARLLGFSAVWLFAEVVPPRRRRTSANCEPLTKAAWQER